MCLVFSEIIDQQRQKKANDRQDQEQEGYPFSVAGAGHVSGDLVVC
jgi:hypothetical protein